MIVQRVIHAELTKAWISIIIGLIPSIVEAIAFPLKEVLLLEINISLGFVTEREAS